MIDLGRLVDLYHSKESTQGAIVKSGREGPIVPLLLHGGLQSPNRIVTPAGTTTIRMARGAM
jgi:hypothetical protein